MVWGRPAASGRARCRKLLCTRGVPAPHCYCCCLRSPPTTPRLTTRLQFGGGYVLSRLPLLRAAASKEAREERCRLLALLGHLLKLQAKFGLLKSGRGGLEETAQKVQAAVS